MKNLTGPPAEDDDFFGRDYECKRIWEELQNGNNILLLGPRRVGKSSMLRYLHKTAPENGYVPVEISLSDLKEEIQVIKRLYAGIGQHRAGKKIVKEIAGGPLKRHFRKFRKFGVGPVSFELEASAAENWATLGESLTEALGKNAQTRWLFLLDEVSVFVQNLIEAETTGARARTFLNWMRELRIGPRAAKQNRWFITGSIGLPTITRSVSLGDTINDLHSPFEHYGPFTPDIARRFLRELSSAYRLPMEDDVVECILARVGWLIPFHLHNIFSKLRDRPMPLTPASVDDAIDALLKSGAGSIFEFWEQRLRKHLNDPHPKYAFAILEPIARDPDGAVIETLSQVLATLIPGADERSRTLRFLIDLLVADGYIVLDRERYRFLSPLLREYWRRHIIP